MRTGMRKGTELLVLPDDQEAGVLDGRLPHGVVGQPSALEHWSELFRLSNCSMRYADSFAVDQIAPEIRGAYGNAESCGGAASASPSRTASPKHIRGRHESRRGEIQQAMQQPEATRAAFGFAPVVQTGDGRAYGRHQAKAEREVSAPSVRVVAGRDLAGVQCQRRRPSAKRYIGEHRMKRMPEPHTVKGVLGCPAGRTRVSKRGANSFAERLSDGIEPRLIRDDVQVAAWHGQPLRDSDFKQAIQRNPFRIASG